MNRRILFVMLFLLVLGAGAFGLLNLTRTKPASDTPVPRADAPAEPASAPSAPVVVTPPPAGPPSSAATRAAEPRRRPAPKPEAAPEPAAVAPPRGPTLHIDSDVAGAQVFVDRTFIGTTPLTTTDVTTGPHRLNLSAPGYEGVAQSIEVSPGIQDVVVKLREVKLDAKLDVIHKHRMGSCSGRLVATPQGMRYETTDKDDAFTSSLLDLETFEVDYLEKNLRIKSRQGKRFDFTDPQGNADQLFVFHRDVDKARERLKKGDPPAQ